MQQEMLPKFRNYVSNACQSDDFLSVQCYMDQVNIEKVISTKLTDSDCGAAEILIEEVSSYPVDKALSFIELLKSFSVITPTQMYALHELNKIFKQNTYDKAGMETLKYICENDNEISKKFK